PGQPLQPGVRAGCLPPVDVGRRGEDLAVLRDIDPGFPLRLEDRVVGRGNHGDPRPAASAPPVVYGELADVAVLVHHFLGPPRLQVEAVDPADLPGPVAVLVLAVLGPQFREVVLVGRGGVGGVVHGPLYDVEGGHAPLDAGDGFEVGAVR